jgi:hypothetical protein
MKFSSSIPITLCLAALISTSQAATVTVSFPEVNGPVVASGFPLPPVDVDTQAFVLPSGAVIVSATLEGVFGATSGFIGSTAYHTLYIDGNDFGSTADVTPDPYFSVVPFSFTEANVAGSLDHLLDGLATLSYVQESEFVVRLSETLLTIEYEISSVPDSGSTLGLLALMGGFGLLRRKKS